MTIADTTKEERHGEERGFARDEAISQTHGRLLRFVNYARTDALLLFCFSAQL
jgi:hypothetical protein